MLEDLEAKENNSENNTNKSENDTEATSDKEVIIETLDNIQWCSIENKQIIFGPFLGPFLLTLSKIFLF